jgi:glucokinase
MPSSNFQSVLAADVGGTHARLGWVELPFDPSQAPRLLNHKRYRCADFNGLEFILQRFLADCHGSADAIAIACAGLRVGDRVISPNLPWALDLTALQTVSGELPLSISNDFEALARASRWLPSNARTLLCGRECGPGESRPILVLGPGTGLGAAIRVRVSAHHEHVIATEAGHAGYAPADQDEVALLAHLQGIHGHVATEALLSGPGLLRIYGAVCAMQQQAPKAHSPEAVSALAASGDDDCAMRAVRMFWDALGNVVGNLVLQTGCFGGVILAGGVLPNIDFGRAQSDFATRIAAKGSMQPAMENVPIYQIEHGELAIVGAAMALANRQ